MLFKPRWVGLLAKCSMPLVPIDELDEKRIRDLEKLRTEFNIPHDVLASQVLASPVTTRKIQRFSLEIFRVRYQDKSEKELFRMVLKERSHAAKSTHTSGEMTEKEIDKAIDNINSFDDLCSYVIANDKDELEQDFHDSFDIGKRIDDILIQQEIDIKAPAEGLIKSSEQLYHDLRKINPERDEHWLLANVWMDRYGSTKDAELKGPELTRFAAYNDTCQFAVLEPPLSIRGLAILWVYRILFYPPSKKGGTNMEQRSIYYNSEFTQITAAVQEYMHSGLFLSKYKKRNPITWEESQFIKSGELLDLRSVLMGLSSLASDGGKRIADSLNRF